MEPTNRLTRRAVAARPFAALVVAVLLVAAGGCHTNEAARSSAEHLAVDLGAYRADQTKRLDDINRHYRFDYAQLVAEMTRLRLDQLDQFFTLGTMEAAAQILSEWETATLPKRIRDRVQESVDERRRRILEVDKAIDEARRSYADAYQAVQVNLSLLKSAQADVESLSIKEDRRQTAVEFVQTVARIVNDLREKSDKAPGAAAP